MDEKKKGLENYLPKIAKGAGIIFVGSIVGRAIGFLSRVIIARSLGPSSYGVISLGMAAVSISIMVSLMGLSHGGIARFISLYKGKENEEGIKGIILSSLKIVLPLSVGTGLLLYQFSGWVSTHIFNDPSLIPVVKILAVGVPLFALFRVLMNVMTGFQRMDYKVYCRKIGRYGSRTGLVALFVLLGYGVIGVAVAYVAAVAFAVLLAFYLLQRKVFPVVGSDVDPSSQTKKLLSYSWPLLLTSYLGLVGSWTDRLMLGFFRTSAEVGFYNAAYPTARLLTFASVPLASIFMPVLSEMYGKGMKKEMEETFRTVTKWVLMLLVPAAVFLILFPSGVLKFLYGSEYTVASNALIVLVIGTVLSPALIFFTSKASLKTVGKTKFIMISSAIGAGLNLLLNYLFIPLFGIMGAAIATSFSTVCGGIFLAVIAQRETDFLSWNAKIAKAIFPVFFGVIPALMISKFLPLNTVATLFSGGLVVISVYFFGVLYLGFFDRKDMIVVKALERKTGLDLRLIRNLISKSYE